MSYQSRIESCEIITDICVDECILYGEVDLIQSAVLNLLSNGIKYSANPKKIFVKLQEGDRFVKISLTNIFFGFAERKC